MGISLSGLFRRPEAVMLPQLAPVEAARADIDGALSEMRLDLAENAADAEAQRQYAARLDARADALLQGVAHPMTSTARAIGVFALTTWFVKLISDYLFLLALKFPAMVALPAATTLLCVFAGFGNMAVGHTGLQPRLVGADWKGRLRSAALLVLLAAAGAYLAVHLGGARADELFGEEIAKQASAVVVLRESGQDPIVLAGAQQELERLQQQYASVTMVSTALFGLLVAAEIGLSGFGIDLLHHMAATRRQRRAQACRDAADALDSEREVILAGPQAQFEELSQEYVLPVASLDQVAEERTEAVLRRGAFIKAAAVALPDPLPPAAAAGANPLVGAGGLPMQHTPLTAPPTGDTTSNDPAGIPRPAWAQPRVDDWDGALA